MTRLRRIETRDRFFFVTTNLARDTAPLEPAERDLILNTLCLQRSLGEFLLFGYVVIPTHVHVLLHPHNKDLIQAMRNFKSRTGYAILQARNGNAPFWQDSYFDAIIRRVRNFWEKLEYIHLNPVAAGLVGRKEDWKWSSYRYYLGSGNVPVPVDPVGFSSDGDQFLWPAPWRQS
ncbi:MAG TPA: transposase [Candidatus Acidoferrales bacterium]|nr:transposase [Candidatus Acidoferrales bacterium]